MSTRSLVRPEGSPTLRYCHTSYRIKEEDVVFVFDDLQRLSPRPETKDKWDLFCLCDGHGGREAAEFAQTHLPERIAACLPTGPQPDTETPEGREWLKQTREALNKAFVDLDVDFQKECAYPNVGCTMTVALFSGWTMTIANIGDSEAFLDLGNGKPIEVTTSHKIDTNQSEQARLKRCGNQISPLSEGFFRPAMAHEEGIGPLRVWPCGLAVSRAIGDQDCGHAVLASPNIKQIKLPFSGARLMIASDGLWDHLSPERAIKKSRKHHVESVPKELIQKAREISEYGLTDDTSVLVVDVVPTPKIDFKEISKKIRGPKSVISRLSKKFGRNKSKESSSVVLINTDMAVSDEHPSFKTSATTFKSSRSIGSQKSRPPAQLTRHNTYAGLPNSQQSTESEEDPEDHKPDIFGLSLNLDHEAARNEAIAAGSRSLERFHSSILN